jgi:hypothetical protein
MSVDACKRITGAWVHVHGGFILPKGRTGGRTACWIALPPGRRGERWGRAGGLVGLPRPSRKQPQSKGNPQRQAAQSRENLIPSISSSLRVTCAYQDQEFGPDLGPFERFPNSNNSDTYASPPRARATSRRRRAPLLIHHACSYISFF